MSERITSKKRMYELLAAGRLGNTTPQFFDRESWTRFVGDYPDKYLYWGVRNAVVADDPRSGLNVPTPDVFRLLAEWYPSGTGFNLSPMIQRYATLNAQTDGRTLEWIDPFRWAEWGHAGHPWRFGFKNCRMETDSPTAVRAILGAYLWPAALEQIDWLLSAYPDHVVEFTACDRAAGLQENNNMIVWECRAY